MLFFVMKQGGREKSERREGVPGYTRDEPGFCGKMYTSFRRLSNGNRTLRFRRVLFSMQGEWESYDMEA
ncbi:hypothetical protein GCM10023310_43210 [Paenibacillus vulneris]